MKSQVNLRKEDYQRFIQSFSGQIGFNSCFYIYGSNVTGKPVYGRSDIDGGIILDSGVVSSKSHIEDISRILTECWARDPVRVQFNLLDRQSAGDGRFLSYDKSFTDWIKQSGRVLAGNREMVDEMTGFRFKDETLRGIAYNFRSVRNGYLNAVRDFRFDPRKLHENLENALENLLKLPKKVLLIQSGKVRDDMPTAISELQNIFPDLDLDFVGHIRKLSRNAYKWYKSIEHDREGRSGGGFPLFTRTLTAFEQIIEAYIKTFPQISDKEVRF